MEENTEEHPSVENKKEDDETESQEYDPIPGFKQEEDADIYDTEPSNFFPFLKKY